jgi:type IV secretory pathway TraG/TraD family ATPase VirD4
MHSTLFRLTHGAAGLVIDYLSVLIPMYVGLIRREAPVAKLVVAPLVAIVSFIVAGIAIAMESSVIGAVGIPNDGVFQMFLGWVIAVAIGYASAPAMLSFANPNVSHRRGSVVTSQPPTGIRTTYGLSLAGVPIATQDETKHFKFIGTTGTGKSTAIRELLNAALARGDRAVIADPDAGYLGNFYNAARGDVILNPFMAGAMKWNALAEIVHDQDVDQLARSLIPDGGDPDHTWTEHARTFFIAVTQRALQAGLKDDAELHGLLTKAPVEELRTLLAGTSAGPLLEPGNDRMFGSVRGTVITAVRVLEYTTRQRAPAFSVRNWIRSGAATSAGGKGGVLFLPYRAGEIAALRSIISAWMRIAIYEAMDRREGDQRLWFVVDELDALGAIDGLKDALARLRKFGGRTVIGFQSIAQVSGTYGRSAADTIVENTANTLILRCSASERGGTSEFASKLIGQREVMHQTRSTSSRPTDWLSSTTMSEHLKIEPAVMASEIERLPDLAGFLKLASNPDWMRVNLIPVNYPCVDIAAVTAPVPTSSPSQQSSPAAASQPRSRARKRS